MTGIIMIFKEKLAGIVEGWMWDNDLKRLQWELIDGYCNKF